MLSVEANDILSMYEQTVKIGSGYEQLVKESPSAVSVITSDDIERMGAISIEEVLETVSGIHVSYVNGFFPVYVIRGVGSTLNTPVLIYLDGIPINNSVLSTSYFSLSHLTKNISRIEIIKGPGSALYGADAFSGVINIITKNKRNEIGTFLGSFDTFGGWLNYGHESNDFKINFSAQGMNTNGSNGIIKRDRQTLIDQLLNTKNSLAPGSVNRGKEEIDIKVSAEYKELGEVYLRYIHKDTQNGIGVANSLDDSGTIRTDAWVTGVKLNFGEEDWKTTFKVNYTGYILDSENEIFPKGTLIGAPNTAPKNQQKYTAHDISLNLSTIYRRMKNHTIHVGSGIEYDTVSDIEEKRNFRQGPFNSLITAGSFQSTKKLGVEAFADSQSRFNPYGFIQDQWDFFNDFSLTAGVRIDYFSDFGLTVNPRASLVWNISSSMTTKLMYGRAFRAPSFFELYSNEGTTVTGNRNLDPETIQTVEWSIQKEWSNKVHTQINLFWNETNDLITEEVLIDRLTQAESRRFVNSNGANTYGLEFDLNYPITRKIMFNMNYAFLDINPKNNKVDQFIIAAPRHQFFAAINWNFIPHWSTNLRSTSVIDRKRSSLDNRSKLKDYTKVDFTLVGKDLLNVFDLTFKINNVFDSNIREPSVDYKSIPGDYPLDDRTFLGMISINF
jgi:iron complex outermembrane receptor protein